MIKDCPYEAPDIGTVCSLPGLLYFAWEREAVRLRRLQGLPREQWTQDEILARYKFTNIHRKHDRVSEWIIKNIIEPNDGRPDLWFILLIARLVNWPPTLQRLIDDGVLFRTAGEFDVADFSRSIEKFKSEVGKVYSGAYMVYPTKLNPGGPKSETLAKHILLPVLQVVEDIDYELFRHDKEASVGRFVEALSKCFGVSTFMAGQVAADMTYTNNGALIDACDLFTYAPMGPGSQRGLNYLHNRSAFASWKQTEFNTALIKVGNSLITELKILDLTLHDVQNIMCEYSKYCRAVLGEGKPKTIYTPEKEF